jgi:hypothetical protein
MSENSRSHAPRISVKISRAQVCQLYSEARYMARMDIQKAILNSDVNNIKSAVERAKEAGLSQPRRCLFPTIVAYSKNETHRECAMKRKLDECEIILYYRNSCKVFVDYLLTEVTASSMCVDALFV